MPESKTLKGKEQQHQSTYQGLRRLKGLSFFKSHFTRYSHSMTISFTIIICDFGSQDIKAMANPSIPFLTLKHLKAKSPRPAFYNVFTIFMKPTVPNFSQHVERTLQARHCSDCILRPSNCSNFLPLSPSQFCQNKWLDISFCILYQYIIHLISHAHTANFLQFV